mgnify:FL=1
MFLTMGKRILLYFFLIFSLVEMGFSQQIPFLERKVTLSSSQERVDVFLKRLSGELGCVFSYSPTAIDVSGTFTGNFVNQSTREILEGVFEGSVLYKERGIYIILTPAPPAEKEVTISGYVVDEKTGEKLRNATIYNPITLKSSTTDEYGFFELQVKNPAEDNFQLVVSKADYSDTLVIGPEKKNYFQNISLKIDPDKLLAWTKDSTGKTKDFWLWNKNSAGAKNIQNVSDTLYRDFQLSLLPFVGTNRKLSGSVVNQYSLNVLGGYSRGTQKVEIGGLFNIDRGEVGKFQAAGVFNYTGGMVSGFQTAGVANVNWDSSQGAQVAGVSNFTLENVEGAQIAGVLNVAGENLKGAQVAGVANFTRKNLIGTQISSILNIAKTVTGSQIALVNYADSIAEGAPVGLISIVRKGYHVVEISTDEVLPMTLSLRTGTRQFYNMLFAGVRPGDGDSTTWAFGYGIGSAPRLGKKLFLNLEVSAEQLNNGNVEALNLISRGNLSLEYQAGRKIALFGGPTFNFRVYDLDYLAHPDLFTGFSPAFVRDRILPDEGVGEQLWWGFRAGIRFF